MGKMKVLVLLSFLFCLGFVSYGQKKPKKVATKDNPTQTVPQAPVAQDTVVKKILGDTLMNLIQKANIVEAYVVDAWNKDTTTNGFGGFKVVKKVNNITKVQKDTLKSILLSKNSYAGAANLYKRCEFIPKIGFRLIKGSQKTEILIDVSCDLLKKELKNYGLNRILIDPAHERIMKLSKSIFPLEMQETTPVTVVNDSTRVQNRSNKKPKQ